VFMTALLIGTFAFFGIHTAFWVIRSGYLYIHDSKTFRESKIKTQTGDEWYTRFMPFEHGDHLPSRELMYSWFSTHLHPETPTATPIVEPAFTPILRRAEIQPAQPGGDAQINEDGVGVERERTQAEENGEHGAHIIG